MEANINRDDLKYKPDKNLYDFKQFKTIRYVNENVFKGKTTVTNESNGKQSNLIKNHKKWIKNNTF